MKYVSIFILVCFNYLGYSQSIIDWSSDYILELEDFESTESEVNSNLKSNTIVMGSSLEFNFHMSSYQFLFTKNFNSKAKTIFNKSAAVIAVQDTLTALQFVKYAQFYFDLTELYTRKFRKEMYENKGAFSDINFFKPYYDRLQGELNARNAQVSKATSLGSDSELLKKEHKMVLQEIDMLPDFCYECKPRKKKKNK